MYGFLNNMWVMGKIDEVYLTAMVAKGYLTQQEKDMIIATPKIKK